MERRLPQKVAWNLDAFALLLEFPQKIRVESTDNEQVGAYRLLIALKGTGKAVYSN